MLELVGVGVAENIYFDFERERFECRHEFAQHHAVPEAGEVWVAVRARDEKSRLPLGRACHRVGGVAPREW